MGAEGLRQREFAERGSEGNIVFDGIFGLSSRKIEHLQEVGVLEGCVGDEVWVLLLYTFERSECRSFVFPCVG